MRAAGSHHEVGIFDPLIMQMLNRQP